MGHNNELKVSSLDESWVLGTIEKMKNLFSTKEKPFLFLYQNRIFLIIPILLSFGVIYYLSKIDKFFLSQTDNFLQWLRFFIYSIIFIVSIIFFCSKWSEIFPKTIIKDVVHDKKIKERAL